MENKPEFVQKLTIENAEYELQITGIDDKYKIELVPSPEVGGQQMWTMLGPQSEPILRETIMVLEDNWQRGSLPVANTDGFFRAMQLLAEAQVNDITNKLVQAGFPSEAVPVFKEFAIDKFAVQIGMSIIGYWEMKKQETKEMQEPDRIEDFSIEGVPLQLRITGAQKMEYQIEFVPVVPWSNPTRETASQMLKAAGLERRFWTVKGPFDQENRRSLISILEDNWRRETLPTDKEQKELRKVIRKLTAHYVDPVIDQLMQESFPADAIPIVRQFAEEDYSFTIGLTIGKFWDEKKDTD